ncbi:hypothetical protein HAP47_0022390 [Bradyrhizobium sp. 41S5]|uniref:hypothetical protein n=1 Tax=Bradyrhizobium sp. 41S5 TaxID=1404443 RepID=UPI00156A94D2|nr:hypothetical protein [Bradyrhizobium sp. 41S5]UFX42025.1 hypothetical protein HAP47_0022390 [Bradyrhizobium sp. 41S5]
MKRWLCTLMFVALVAVFVCGTSSAQTPFDLAEERIVDCAAHSNLHPPYGGDNDVMQVCSREIEAYQRACVARVGAVQDAEIDCGMAGAASAQRMQNRDPVDVQFVNCLRGKGRGIEALSVCRVERRAFEANCQKRKDVSQCQKDAEFLAGLGLRER